MIISLNVKNENIYYKIFETVNISFTRLGLTNGKAKGWPRKYPDEQIVAYMLYGIKNSIFSLRQLEYRIKQDYIFQSIINLQQVPDYSIFSLRAAALEKHIFMVFMLWSLN